MRKLFSVLISSLCLSSTASSAVALSVSQINNELNAEHLANGDVGEKAIILSQDNKLFWEKGQGTRNNALTSSDLTLFLLAQNPPSNPSLPNIPPNIEPRPNIDRFLQPEPLIPPVNPQQQTPVLEQTPPPTTTPSSPPVRFLVNKITVTGNTILTSEINAIIKAVEGKEVTLEELGKVADAITQLYVQRGYITSRAVVPDQQISSDGAVQILVIEGSLERIEIEGTRRLNRSYVRSRVRLGAGKPLSSAKLEDQLRLLRFNPLFENVEASLRPGTGQGQSVLVVRVTEANPFRGTYLSVDNYSSPSVGSERLGANIFFRNVSGVGDAIYASYYHSTTGGSDVLDFNYTLPLNAMDGTLQLRAAPNFYEITEQEFKELGISGKSELYEISFRQPLIRSPRQEFALSIGFNYRNSRTFLEGNPFSFGGGADEEGRTRTRAINFGQEYIKRDPQGATALRSLFSFGIDVFDATTNPDPTPDGRFFTWLGQIQRVQRLSNNNLLIIQGEVQLTPDSLLSAQQFVIGGGQSVRGYRQNIRSGDNGFRFSLEDRIILQRNQSGKETLQLAPFADMGTVWNNPDNPSQLPRQKFLAGIGLGLLWEPIPRLNLRVDYAYPLVDLRDRGENAQDRGFFFQVNYQL